MDFYINLDTNEEFQTLEELTDKATVSEIIDRLYILEEKYKLASLGYNEAIRRFKKKEYAPGAEFISQLYRNMQLLNEKAYDLLAVLLEKKELSDGLMLRLGRLLYDTHSYI